MPACPGRASTRRSNDVQASAGTGSGARAAAPSVRKAAATRRLVVSMRLDTLVIMRRGRSRTTAFGLDPVAARNAPRAPSHDDGRGSQTTSGRRPLGTTSRSRRSGVIDHRRRREPAAPHVALAAMRAITHVVGKAIRSSRRRGRAARWLRDDRRTSGLDPLRSAPMSSPSTSWLAVGGQCARRRRDGPDRHR